MVRGNTVQRRVEAAGSLDMSLNDVEIIDQQPSEELRCSSARSAVCSGMRIARPWLQACDMPDLL